MARILAKVWKIFAGASAKWKKRKESRQEYRRELKKRVRQDLTDVWWHNRSPLRCAHLIPFNQLSKENLQVLLVGAHQQEIYDLRKLFKEHGISSFEIVRTFYVEMPFEDILLTSFVIKYFLWESPTNTSIRSPIGCIRTSRFGGGLH